MKRREGWGEDVVVCERLTPEISEQERASWCWLLWGWIVVNVPDLVKVFWRGKRGSNSDDKR